MRERPRRHQIGLDLSQKLNHTIHRKRPKEHAVTTWIFESGKVLSLANPRKKRYLPKTIIHNNRATTIISLSQMVFFEQKRKSS